MTIVIDSSAILALAMEDEDASLGEAAVRSVIADGGLAPALLWYEVRNALVTSERRGRLTPGRTEAFLSEIAALPINFDFAPPSDAVLALARKYALTIYDAAYLELALRSDSAIATLDVDLSAAVKAAGGKLFT